MCVVCIRLIRVQSHKSGFSRRRSNSDDTGILFGPIEGGIVGEFVTDAYLTIRDFSFGKRVNLAETEAIAGDIDDEETWVFPSGVR